MHSLLSCSSSLSMMLDSESSETANSGKSSPNNFSLLTLFTSSFFLLSKSLVISVTLKVPDLVESINKFLSIVMTQGSMLSPSN